MSCWRNSRLNLLDCVESLSTHTLQKILEHHPLYSITSEEGSTLSFLLDIVYLNELWGKMGNSEQRVMIAFLIHSSNSHLSFSSIHEVARLSVGEALVGLTLLRQKGLIYTHRRYFGEVAYFIPSDLRGQFLQLFLLQQNHFEQSIGGADYQQVIFYEDLWKLLQYIRFNPLQLTQKGSVHKRQLMHLETLIPDTIAATDKLPLRFDGSNLYSKGLALYLDFAIYFDLIGECEDQLVIRDEQVTDWLLYTEVERIDYLWNYFRKRLSTFYSIEMQLLLDWLYLQPFGKWARWQSYLDFLQQLRRDSSQYHHITSLDLIHMLQSFGLITLTEVEGMWWIVRPTPLVEGETRGYIQSNLQILLPMTMPISILWKIGEFADLIQRDQMATYEISKSSIERAVEVGWNEERIFSFLTSITSNIPENVQIMIRNWIHQYTKLQFLDLTVLECQDESLLSELINQPIFVPFIVQPLSSKHLIVRREKLMEFREVLEQAGYTPMKRLITFGEDEKKIVYAASPILKTMIQTATKVENVYPEWEETFPGIRSIPKTWVNTFRSYHPSSMIDLLKRAQQNHLQLSLRLTDDTEVQRVSPVELNHIGGDMMLRFVRPSIEPISNDEWVSLKEIKEMAVHLPYS